MKIENIKKRSELFLKKLAAVFNYGGRDKGPDLLIPNENYLKLKNRYYSYKNLLLKNNELLDALSELNEGLDSGTMSIPVFRSYLARIFNTAFKFIQSLNDMSDSRYMYLYDVLERIRKEAEKFLDARPQEHAEGFVVPVEKITEEYFKDTGGKAANLGEIKNILKLPVPRGFSITVQAYREFVSYNKLDERLNRLVSGLSIDDTDRIEEVSKEIRELVLNAEVPPALIEAVRAEAGRIGEGTCFSVRSSAVGEDGKVSFAGQFKSVLNVKSGSLIDAYKEVVASKYSVRALFYRIAKGVRNRDMPMAVLVLEMIDSRSSGVLYTLNPGYPERDETILSSVWGQGQYAVGGKVSPDTFTLDRRNNGEIISRNVPEKKVSLVLKRSGGVEERSVTDDMLNAPSISDEEIRMLYHYSSIIERHFESPQDIEWSIDNDMRLHILQARPLNIRRVVTASIKGGYRSEKNLVSAGDPAVRGVASGSVFIIQSFDQIHDFPAGAVLVAKNTSNEFVRIMESASAIIIGTGSRTSHLATVSREFGVPMIINTGDISDKLQNGDVVTVDANSGRIYRGRVEDILRTKTEVRPEFEMRPDEKIMRSVMKKITPLNLTQIDEAEISVGDFRTIHDIVRYVHEVSVKEMFRIGELTEGSGSTQQLVSKSIPMYFYVIDLDGGIAEEARFIRKISPEHIRSVPFRALWRGMTYEGVKWAGAVDIDMAGLGSVMARSFVRTGVSEKGGKVYVIMTDQYVNMSVKLAYHFTVFDAFCGESYINNYINFRFQGGGASAEGRHRRALFIKEVLESLDFRVEIKDDMVIADIKGASKKGTEHRLDILGRLLGCTRQLDMAISSLDAKDWYVKEFLAGNYSFKRD